MALIDSRGRLFGRINMIDAAVAVVVLGIIPLAYAAYVLFRQPQPSLVSITPAKLTPQVTRVQIKGHNLRPFLRISFNQFQGKTFAFIDAETAEVELPPDLAPGRYDVVLYDVARDVSRLPEALTVEAPSEAVIAQGRMLIAGRFVGLDEGRAKQLQDGLKLSAVGGNALEIVSHGETTADRRWFGFVDHLIETPLTAGLQVPALLRATCSVAEKRCQVGGRDVEAGFGLTLYTSEGNALRFEVSDAVGEGPTSLVNLRVRFVIPSDSVAAVKQGDRARRDPLLGDRVPTLTAVGGARSTTALMNLPGPPGIGGGEWALQMTDDASFVDATVRLRGDVTSGGLQYRGRPLRVGAPFVFEHERYVLRGWVRALDVLSGGADDR